jgi:hypothetical protein
VPLIIRVPDHGRCGGYKKTTLVQDRNSHLKVQLFLMKLGCSYTKSSDRKLERNRRNGESMSNLALTSPMNFLLQHQIKHPGEM